MWSTIRRAQPGTAGLLASRPVIEHSMDCASSLLLSPGRSHHNSLFSAPIYRRTTPCSSGRCSILRADRVPDLSAAIFGSAGFDDHSRELTGRENRAICDTCSNRRSRRKIFQQRGRKDLKEGDLDSYRGLTSFERHSLLILCAGQVQITTFFGMIYCQNSVFRGLGRNVVFTRVQQSPAYSKRIT